jgi:hypothetical protein
MASQKTIYRIQLSGGHFHKTMLYGDRTGALDSSMNRKKGRLSGIVDSWQVSIQDHNGVHTPANRPLHK